jgi:hypothetical protein
MYVILQALEAPSEHKPSEITVTKRTAINQIRVTKGNFVHFFFSSSFRGKLLKNSNLGKIQRKLLFTGDAPEVDWQEAKRLGSGTPKIFSVSPQQKQRREHVSFGMSDTGSTKGGGGVTNPTAQAVLLS